MGNKVASAGLTADQLNAIVKKLGGKVRALKFLCDKRTASKWHEKNGEINLGSVTSDGTTGPDWIKRLKKNGFRVDNWAKMALVSPYFKPTNGVTTKITILKGESWLDGARTTENIRYAADHHWLVQLIAPNAEVACLIREKFTDKEIKEMGFSMIVTMHEPIKDNSSLFLLGVTGAGRGLTVYCERLPIGIFVKTASPSLSRKHSS